jgi:energy-coupling factor transporter ATP-binding protein EcfA2
VNGFFEGVRQNIIVPSSGGLVYESFRILIDDPAPKPDLGFDDYAASLAEIVRLSRPQFAVGIFGAWGSGKTTLMKAIEHDLEDRSEVISVWFNAWRYEKEEHLIVPLLDTVREALLVWGAGMPEEIKTGARRMASAIGRAARAILVGLTLKAGLPGAVEVSLDANKVATAWRQPDLDTESAFEPKSFYHASFMALRKATEEFISGAEGPAQEEPARRFVIFIDDLDRCLPDKALQVLESMKLFFDLDGFVFVVGLDQLVIERAVQVKYPAGTVDQQSAATTYLNGVDYVKKIFQVQFTTPRIDQGQLPKFLDSIADAAQLPDEQRQDLRDVVTPQVNYIAGTASVNPREVKRLVNAYTMQMKMLERKLKDQQRTPSAPAVLALQVMSFRTDWQATYQALSNRPSEFVDATADALDRGSTAIAVAEEVIELPLSLVGYLRAEGAPLLKLGDLLEVYVSTAEAAQSTDHSVREIAQVFGRLRVAHKQAQASSAVSVKDVLGELVERLDRQTFKEVEGATLRARGLHDAFPSDAKSRLTTDPPGSAEYAQQVALLDEWLANVGRELAPISQALADLRKRTLSSTAAA